MGGAKDKKAKETEKTESPDLPTGGTGDAAPTQVPGEGKEESKAVIQDQAEASSSPAPSKGKPATWGRSLLSLRKLQRRSRDESEDEKASSSKSGSQKSCVEKDDIPATAPLAEEEPLTPDGPPPGCSFFSAVGIRTPSKRSDGTKTSKSGSRKTEEKSVKNPTPEAAKTDEEKNVVSKSGSRKTEEEIKSPKSDSRQAGEETIGKSSKVDSQKTHESVQVEASPSGQGEDRDAKSGCSFLNAMGIRSPMKGGGEKRGKSSKTDTQKTSNEEKPSQAEASLQAGNTLSVTQDQEVISPDPASAGCSFLNVVGLGSSCKSSADKKLRKITAEDEKSPPSKQAGHQRATLSPHDRQNTLSDEDFTFSDESDGLTTALMNKLLLEESIKSPTSMQSGTAEDTMHVSRSAVATLSGYSDREISSVFSDRHMSSESEEHALSLRSAQFRTSGDADNEETTSGDTRPQGCPRPPHSNPKHPDRRYQASSKLTAQQQGRTSSESEETEGLQGSDSVFYTEKSESSHRTSEGTDEYALDFMESREEETGTSAQISLSFPRPLPKVIEDVAMGPGGRFTDDYTPSSDSTSLMTRSGNKIIIASTRGISTERLISSSTTATQTDELLPPATQSEEPGALATGTQSDAPQSSAPGTQPEGPVSSTPPRSGAPPLGTFQGPVPPKGTATQSEGLLSPEGTATQSEGLLSSEGTATQSEGLLSSEGTATQSEGLLSPEGTATQSEGLLSTEGTATHSGEILTPEGTVTHSEGLLSPEGTVTHSEGLLSPDGTVTHSEELLSPEGTATQSEGILSPAGSGDRLGDEADDEGVSEDSKDLTDSDPRSSRQDTPGGQGQEESSRFSAQPAIPEEGATQGNSEMGLEAFGRSDSLRTITEEDTPQDSPVDEDKAGKINMN